MNITTDNSITSVNGVYESKGVTNNASNGANKVNADDTAAILTLSRNGDSDGVVTIKRTSSVSNASSNMSYAAIVNTQNALRALGFYNGGNYGYVSSDTAKAIKDFQKAYRLEETGVLTMDVYTTIKAAGDKFNYIYNSKGLDSIVNNTDFKLDAIEKKNFALIWSYLSVGMNLNDEQIVGVMANIHAESRFSTDNLQGNDGDHNPEYVYDCSDKKGYGILQWTDKTRKEELEKMSKEIGWSISNIYTQLAYFKKEMTTNFSNLYYKSKWDEVKATTNYIEACDVFMEKIEAPRELKYETRRNYASIIYNALLGEDK